MRSLTAKDKDRFLIQHCVAVTSKSVCKLFPAAWLRQHRFQEDLRSGEDVVFNGTLFSRFDREFTEYDRRPFLAEARYYRRLTEDSVSRAAPDFDFGITQRIEVMKRITEGLYEDPADRIQLISILLDGQSSLVHDYLAEHPQERPRAMQAISDSGVRGLNLVVSEDLTWPSYSVLTGGPSWRPRHTILLLAGSTAPINRLAQQITFLRDYGVTVRLGYFRGILNQSLGTKSQHRFAVMREGNPVAPLAKGSSRLGKARHRMRQVQHLARKVGRRAAPHLMPGKLAVNIAARVDAPGKRLLRKGGFIISLDSDGQTLAVANKREAHDVGQFHAWVLALAGRCPAKPSQAAAIVRSAEWLSALPADDPLLPPARVWSMAVWRLLRNRRTKQARNVLKIARRVFPHDGDDEGFAMLDLMAKLPDLDTLPADTAARSAVIGASADRALEDGDVDKATFLINTACEVIFAQDHNTNVPHPPILKDPDALLSGLRRSKTWSLLGSSSAPEAPAAAHATPRVLVLPGTYPKFAGIIFDSLKGRAEVTELRLRDLDKDYETTGVSHPTIRRRLGQAGGFGLDVPSNITRAFADKDAVFVDWADKGAVLASMLTPPGTRLIIRFHGVDSLGLWQMLVDWGRVTDVVFVSEHLRRSVERILGDKIAHVRAHVIPNGLDVERFGGSSTPEARRTLGMVGWAQRVKDPLWTLDVLAELRAQDPAWKLRLIGNDFQPTSRKSEREYTEAFRTRALQPDLVEAIEYVGFTTDLPSHVADIGFAISSSLRESFHIGAVEMVAAQAVPVIRNWPVYRDLDGATGLFPSDWVVDTPAEAAQRILNFADEDRWEQEASAAREIVRERFRAQDLGDAYRAVVLG